MSKNGKRKRRSFYTPDSKAVAAWIDAQSDLGMSLQIVAVDAMARYGKGDVVKAYLKHRENAHTDVPDVHTHQTDEVQEHKYEREERANSKAEVSQQPPDLSAAKPQVKKELPVRRQPEPSFDQESELEDESPIAHDDVLSRMMRSNDQLTDDSDSNDDDISDDDRLRILLGDSGSELQK